MELSLNLSKEIESVVSKFDELSVTMKRRATYRALNSTARGLRVIQSKEIRRVYASIKASDIKSQVKIARANAANLESRVSLTSSPQSLGKFGAKRIKKGVSVRVNKLLGRKRLTEGAFLVENAAINSASTSGGSGVFERYGAKVAPSKGRYAGRVIKRGRRKGQPILRQKLSKKYTFSVSEMAAAKSVGTPTITQSNSIFVTRLTNELKFEMKRLLGKDAKFSGNTEAS